MKKIILIFFLLATFNQGNAQVDSLHWDNLSNPHTFYAKIDLNVGHQLKYIDQYTNNDTVFIDLIFSDCGSVLVMYSWDSIITISSSVVDPQYNFLVRFVLDSNTITTNSCFIHPRLYDTIFTSFMPAGIEENELSRLSELILYPNPVQQKLIISSQGISIRSYEIMNAIGALIIQEKYNGDIDVSKMPQGTYFIKVETEKGYRYSRFQKQ